MAVPLADRAHRGRREPACALRVVRTLELDGGYLTARLVGHVARIVLSSPIGQRPPLRGPGQPQERPRRRARPSRTARSCSPPARGHGFPRVPSAGRRRRIADSGPLVQCRNVRRPTGFSGLGMLTVLTVDLARGLEPVDADAIVSDGRIVYASPASLYVATERWDPRAADGRPVADGVTTAIHRFDISSPTQTNYRGSGTVPGVLLNQWSLSECERGPARREHRAAGLVGRAADESESSLTTLGQRRRARPRLGRVGGLGKGERVYAVRFVGDTGYVVTFRQVDPLYTLDLSDAGAPGRARRAEDPRLLRLPAPGRRRPPARDRPGRDRRRACRSARRSRSSTSPTCAARRGSTRALGQGWSEAEHDHHAFLFWPRTRLVVIPLQAYGDRPFVGALGLRVAPHGRHRRGRPRRPIRGQPGASPSDRRGHRSGARSWSATSLYTVSDAGVKASSLGTFAGPRLRAAPAAVARRRRPS